MTYGLGTLLAVGIAIAFWRILIYVLKENSNREERLAGIIEKDISLLQNSISHVSDLLIQHDSRAVEAIKGINEANQYQRQEHKEMIEILHSMRIGQRNKEQ